MNKHHHEDSHKHEHQHHESKPYRPHKDWKLWVVVGLMLAAMVAYVLTMDESIVPGANNEEPEVPASP